ncbi:hypothetical protein [Celeribacter baekdonensis]|uniref:hypothetical protein n=1 Tax=Celeribacter baekdonensis TaxID=875171 RepID=UPI0030DABCA5|tara:strand:- start:30212 stop:30607 length:396 start_codon:yes stop_codon:yes gene_type:complete
MIRANIQMIRPHTQTMRSLITMIAALAFAVLSGLHGARPVSLAPAPAADAALFAELGFSASDICGYGGTGSGSESRCPNCVISTAAVVPYAQGLFAPSRSNHTSPRVFAQKACAIPQLIRVKTARAPPVLT